MPEEVRYGGQAVIEGVMMAGPEEMAVAVRRPSGEIIVEKRPVHPAGKKKRAVLKLPLVRGCAALWNSLRLGIFALMFSAGQACEEDEGELTWREMSITTALSLVLGVGLFIVLPAWGGGLLVGYGIREAVANLAEGFLRLALFLGYLAAISRI